ncbi:hypothetical protein Sjap_002761 [Stephania japonica]|uniref:Uncharacterized protein n=1 Tax=Stephania japonica TaxID=461633 RepID=A0AAP0KMN8_9MAGN
MHLYLCVVVIEIVVAFWKWKSSFELVLFFVVEFQVYLCIAKTFNKCVVAGHGKGFLSCVARQPIDLSAVLLPYQRMLLD